MAKDRSASPLLKLLNEREAWTLPEYRPPVFTPKERTVVLNAAMEHGWINKSDPFARARMRLYLFKGYELLSDVIKANREGGKRNAR